MVPAKKVFVEITSQDVNNLKIIRRKILDNIEIFTGVDDLIEVITITKIIEAYEKACEK